MPVRIDSVARDDLALELSTIGGNAENLDLDERIAVRRLLTDVLTRYHLQREHVRLEVGVAVLVEGVESIEERVRTITKRSRLQDVTTATVLLKHCRTHVHGCVYVTPNKTTSTYRKY